MKRDRRHLVYPAIGAVLLFLSGLLGRGVAQSVPAQVEKSAATGTSAVRWRLLFDGQRAEWPGTQPKVPLDSLTSVVKQVLGHFRRAGYYYAAIDSATVDTSAQPPIVRLHGHRGPRVQIEELRIKGVDAVPKEELRSLMNTDEGEPLLPKRLETDIQALLDRYEEIGRPLAQIRVTETRLSTHEEPALQVTLKVEEGPKLWLKRIVVPDDARTSPELLAHLADLEVGAPLRGYDPDTIRHRLQKSDLFRDVGRPKLRVDSDGGAILRIPIEEASPGSFNFVLGYLPATRAHSSGQLVGSGHLRLENIFGGGRIAEFTLDRRPGRTSIVDVSVSDPYLLGLPLRVRGRFRGEQRDSTYGERTFRLESGYRLGGGLEITASLSREVVRPGPAGARLRRGRQQIPRSSTLFYGLGVRYQRIDRPKNPRKGLLVSLQVSQGRKERRVRRVTPEGDTTRFSNSIRQERLRARVRAYFPLLDRHVMAIGGDGAVLVSSGVFRDRSDLFRLGGAESLRGYDEDRFLGNVVARGLIEYRFRFDPGSYAYAFMDLGYVARPALIGLPATRGWHPGYGLGVRFQTAIGQITTTYALNPEVKSPSNGRIHLGLSVGL